MAGLLKALNLKSKDMYTRLVLLGHLLTVPSDKPAVAEVEDVPMLFEGIIQEVYKPDIALNQKYWNREHLFWDALVDNRNMIGDHTAGWKKGVA
ncbi:hypothetical protein DSO57_1026469 [Entomophthora muscae]|uniref:Uncharacterized protein n=1 Tax=Entomophthora muscae TaxID=34485 RepID=A0ACC2SR77_9FUNG|nr:hypothetical protein DSO57_1026469 [Entomophthora muscae]